MSNWYLIENAPKDGTWVLLAGGECACEGNGRRTVVGQWTEYLNGRVSPENGRWQFAWYAGGYLGEYINPTHWMPLPIYQPQQKQDPVYLECGEKMLIEKKFKEVLDKTIEKVFENENAFLSRFFSKYKNIELISFYMSSGRCEAHCCDMKSGNHFFYNIDTNDFIEWVNNLNKEQPHIAQTCEKCGASNVRAAVQMCSVDPDSDEVYPGSALWR